MNGKKKEQAVNDGVVDIEQRGKSEIFHNFFFEKKRRSLSFLSFLLVMPPPTRRRKRRFATATVAVAAVFATMAQLACGQVTAVDAKTASTTAAATTSPSTTTTTNEGASASAAAAAAAAAAASSSTSSASPKLAKPDFTVYKSRYDESEGAKRRKKQGNALKNETRERWAPSIVFFSRSQAVSSFFFPLYFFS